MVNGRLLMNRIMKERLELIFRKVNKITKYK